MRAPETYIQNSFTPAHNVPNMERTYEKTIIQRLQREMEEMQRKIQMLTLQNQSVKDEVYTNTTPRITRTFDIKNQYPNPFAINVYPRFRDERTGEYYRNRSQPEQRDHAFYRGQEYREDNRFSYEQRARSQQHFPNRMEFNQQQNNYRRQSSPTQDYRQRSFQQRGDRNTQYKRLVTCPYCKNPNPHNWSICGEAQDQIRRQPSVKPPTKPNDNKKN